jgi:L-seryl-tRNA(Ser) seleniumtransferase
MAERLAAAGWTVAFMSGSSAIGGGSAPGVELPTVLLALARAGRSADQLDAALRALDPPVIARIEDDRLVIDVRSVDPADDERLTGMIIALP